MRIACCVPGCRRTSRGDAGFDEWICAKHWPAIARAGRLEYLQAKRRAKKHPSIGRLVRATRLWERMKCEAIEKAFGI